MFLDDKVDLRQKCVMGVTVVCGVDEWLEQPDHSAEVIIAVGHNPDRLRLARRLERGEVQFANVIHPSVVIMPSAKMGRGISVFAQAVVNSSAQIGHHVVINTSVVVEHDCVIEDGASLSPGVRMGGRVVIGQGAFLGTGATCVPRITIGERAIVGAGSVVTRDIPADTLAYGVPARVLRAVQPEKDWAQLL
jgi:acetyltransferase EpsM